MFFAGLKVNITWRILARVRDICGQHTSPSLFQMTTKAHSIIRSGYKGVSPGTNITDQDSKGIPQEGFKFPFKIPDFRTCEGSIHKSSPHQGNFTKGMNRSWRSLC